MQKQILDQIILQLKQIEVDGESMEYILKETGMDQQMLRQLVMRWDTQYIKDLLMERVDLQRQQWLDEDQGPEYDSAGFTEADR